MARAPKSTKKARSTVAEKQQRSTVTEKQRRAGGKAACCARDKDRYKKVIFPDLHIADYIDDRCDQCGFEAKTTIAKLRHLVAHIPRDHPAWTAFHLCECIICGKPHANMDQVADHFSRSHRKSFNYPCPHENCTMRKGDRSGIYRHRRKVHNYRTKKEREAEAAAEAEAEMQVQLDEEAEAAIQLDAEVAVQWEDEAAENAGGIASTSATDSPVQTIQDCSAPTSSSSTPLATPPPPGFSSSFEVPCERAFGECRERAFGAGRGLPSSYAAVYDVDAFASFVPDRTMESEFGGVNAQGFDHVARGFDHVARGFDHVAHDVDYVAQGFTNVDEFAGPVMGLEFDAFSQLSQPSAQLIQPSAHAMVPHLPHAAATPTIPGMAAPIIPGMAPQLAPLPAPAMALGYPATGAPQIVRPSHRSQTGIQFSGFEFSTYPDGWTHANIPRPMCFPPVPPPTWTAEAGMQPLAPKPQPLTPQPANADIDAFTDFDSMGNRDFDSMGNFDSMSNFNSLDVSDSIDAFDSMDAFASMDVSDAYHPWFDLRGAPMVDFGDAIVP